MPPIRALLKSTYFRVALFIVIVMALTAHPVRKRLTGESREEKDEREYRGHNLQVVSSDQHFDDRIVLTGSSLFNNVENAHTPAAKDTAIEAMCQAHHFPTWKQSGRKFYDLVMISSELDWLEVRLHTLGPYVDYFVIVEAATTFTGLPKELVLQKNWDRFKEFHHKMVYKVVEDTLEVKEGAQWDHETFLRNAMLTETFPAFEGTEKQASEGDVILVSDLDEIIRPEAAMILRHCDYPKRLRLRSRFFYYAYQWQHRNGDWDHPQATTYGGSIQKTLAPEALRKELWDPKFSTKWWKLSSKQKEKQIGEETTQIKDAGWHCSSCFETIAQVIDKLNAFSHVEFNSPENRDPKNIIRRYQNGLDLFGRPEEEFGFDKVAFDDVPGYVQEQHNLTGRFSYLLDRSGKYAEFTDAKALLNEREP